MPTKCLDIFNPAGIRPAPAPVAAPETLSDCPELRRKTEPRKIRQQFLFAQSTLDRLNAASEKYAASKNSIVVAAVEEYLKKLEG